MKTISRSALLLCCMLAVLPLGASAAALAKVGAIRVWVIPVGEISATAGQSLSADKVVQDVGGLLAARGYRWQRINGGPLQPGTTTVRVLYSVTDQTTTGSVTIAAAAATQLLQTAIIGGGKATVSFYAGLQQSLRQQSSADAALQDVNKDFQAQLRVRINQALDRMESQK